MTLISFDELARGAVLLTFGGLAGGATLAFPGSPLWLLPAGAAVAGCALTVPEIRAEAARALPQLLDAGAQARALLGDMRQRGPRALLAAAPAQDAPRAQTPPPAPSTRQRPAQAAQVNPLFVTLDEEPHRLIIGHTRGGKSTAMHAMTANWARQGLPVVVCDPDAAHGQWPGCKVAGYNEDYAGIARALSQVGGEFKTRSKLYSEGQRDFEPLHLVIDEVQEVFAALPPSKKAIETFARRGAKRGIFVTLGTQDNHVDSLGLDSAAVLQNFITAELRKDAEGKRVATVYRGNAAHRRDARTFAVPQLPDPKSYITPRQPTPATGTTQLVRRAEQPAQAARPANAEVSTFLLDSLLAEVPAHQDAAEPARVPVPQQNQNRNLTGSVVTVGAGTRADVEVNVTQVAAHAPAGRTAGRGRRGLDVKARRLRALYRKAGAEGKPFKPFYAEHKGDKSIVFPAWQEGRATTKGNK